MENIDTTEKIVNNDLLIKYDKKDKKDKKNKAEKEKLHVSNKDEVPKNNPENHLCDFFIQQKMRFCKFPKMKNYDLCQHHNESVLVECPLCKHQLLKDNLNKHKKVCKAVKEKEKLESTYWYKKEINLLRKLEDVNTNLKENSNFEIKLNSSKNELDANANENESEDEEQNNLLIAEELNSLFDPKEVKNFIPKLIKAYLSLREKYLNYLVKTFPKELNFISNSDDQDQTNNTLLLNPDKDHTNNLKNAFINKVNSIDFNFSPKDTLVYYKNYLISGLVLTKEDLNQTKQIKKFEKHTKQGEELSKLMIDFKIINDKNSEKNNNTNKVFIEFGAGRGGLTEKVIESTDNKSYYILLERDGIRNKKDHISSSTMRIRTDILNFDINSLPRVFEEIEVNKSKYINYNDNKNKTLENDKENLNLNLNLKTEGKKNSNHNSTTIKDVIGIAKHICGCALDMSVTCLLNLKKENNTILEFNGLCFATCCHHRGHVNNFLGYDSLLNELNFSTNDFNLLFKTSSWLFENPNSPLSEKYKNVLASQFEKKTIGLISKYVVDLSRVLYLVDNGKKALYLKYISNEVTTENNCIIVLDN